MNIKKRLTISLLLASLFIGTNAWAEKTLLNVSYDPTRELYQEFNVAFAKYWQAKNNEKITIRQSHGGSGKQARSVIDGLEADVVTLALANDINAIAEKAKLLPEKWQQRLAVITPNPKTSGGAQWNYLAAWQFGKRKFAGDESKVKEFVTNIYNNVPVLDSGARGSTTTFVERSVGDVLISWENEAFLALKEYGADKFEVVIPTFSILAEPPVAVVDKVVDKRGTRQIAEAYLEYLYSEEGQEIAAKHFYRPTNSKVAEKYVSQFPKVELFKIDEAFGGWKNAHKTHFADGATFDQIYLKR